MCRCSISSIAFFSSSYLTADDEVDLAIRQRRNSLQIIVTAEALLVSAAGAVIGYSYFFFVGA